MQKNVVDELGRVTLPKTLLEELRYKEGYKFECELEAKNIILIMVEEQHYKQTRVADELNRIVLPIELRKQAGLETGDILEFKINGTKLVLTKSSKF